MKIPRIGGLAIFFGLYKMFACPPLHSSHLIPLAQIIYEFHHSAAAVPVNIRSGNHFPSPSLPPWGIHRLVLINIE
jgi:hypothetical protein